MSRVYHHSTTKDIVTYVFLLALHGYFTSPPYLQRAAERISECEHAIASKQGQHNGDGLPQSDRSGNRRTAEDDGCKETQLDSVGSAVLDLVASEAV